MHGIDRRTVGLVVSLMCGAAALNAQSVREALQQTTSLNCEFHLMATGTWSRDGTATAETRPASLALRFSNVDAQSGTAVIEGSTGAPHIVVQGSGGYLHFVQMGNSGVIYVTTVFDKISSPGHLKAVHTRHEYTEVSLPGYTSRPQQYYGECTIPESRASQ